jgi:hypothetical protein
MVESLSALWAAGGERAEDLDHFRQDKALALLLGHDLPAAQTARGSGAISCRGSTAATARQSQRAGRVGAAALRPRLRLFNWISRSITASVPVCRNASINPGTPACPVINPVSSSL